MRDVLHDIMCLSSIVDNYRMEDSKVPGSTLANNVFFFQKLYSLPRDTSYMYSTTEYILDYHLIYTGVPPNIRKNKENKKYHKIYSISRYRVKYEKVPPEICDPDHLHSKISTLLNMDGIDFTYSISRIQPSKQKQLRNFRQEQHDRTQPTLCLC